MTATLNPPSEILII